MDVYKLLPIPKLDSIGDNMKKETEEFKKRFLTCKICGKKTALGDKYGETVIYPNDFCNVAIKLDCGHWMVDDCEPDAPIKNGQCFATLEDIKAVKRKSKEKLEEF